MKNKIIALLKMLKYILYTTLFYFIFLFGFALCYKLIADDTNGKSFLFQEDIKLNSQCIAFNKETNNNISLDLFKNLVKNLPNKKELGIFSLIRDTSKHLILPINQIGADWANYYIESFKREGISHYKITKEDSGYIRGFYNKKIYKLNIEFFENTSNDYVENGQFGLSPIDTCFDTSFNSLEKEKHAGYLTGLDKKEVETNKMNDNNNKYGVGIPTDFSNFKKIKNLSVFESEQFFPLKYNFDTNNYIPISQFDYVLKGSQLYLDESILKLYKILEGKYHYNYLDFFYFSAVTITTLGYGDILPNSTLVRILVSVESIFGIIFLGLFVSFLFNLVNRGPNNN